MTDGIKSIFVLRFKIFDSHSTNYKLSTTNYKLSTTNYKLSTTNYPLKTIFYKLLIK